jgi:hypothetical protein
MVRIQGFAIVLALTAQASFAQTMYKCQNAGKVEYSDRPCAGVEVKRLAPDGGPTPEDRARAKMRVAAEQERFAAQERQVAAARSGIASTLPDQGTSSAPDPDNEKVLTHSKSGWDRKPKGQIAAEINAARHGRDLARAGETPPATGDAAAATGKAWESEKALIHSQSGWDRKTRGEIVADKASQAYRAERSRIESAKAQVPANISNCDAGGCWDTSGQRYNGSGPTLTRADGRPCQRVSAMVYCN